MKVHTETQRNDFIAQVKNIIELERHLENAYLFVIDPTSEDSKPCAREVWRENVEYWTYQSWVHFRRILSTWDG